MIESRRFQFLYIGVFLAYAIIMLFFSFQDSYQLRKFIRNQEIPALGSAVSAHLHITSMQYRDAGDALLQNNFIRDWIIDGEKDSDSLLFFLEKIRSQFDGNLLDVSVVSDLTETYYGTDGRIVFLSPSNLERDGWYYYYRDTVKGSNIDSWYYPESGVVGIYINVPIVDENKGFIGVAGAGIDSLSFTKLIQSFERNSLVNIYLVRSDGEMVYSTQKDLLSGAKQHIDTVWNSPVFDVLQRSRDMENGTILEPDGSRGAILWAGYLPEWNTFLIVEREASSLRTMLLPSLFRSLFAGSILILVLLAITVYVFQFFYTQINRTVLNNREIIHRFQAVIDGQNRLLKTAESWLITFGGTLARKNPDDLIAKDALDRSIYLQQARNGLRTALFTELAGKKSETIFLSQVIDTVATSLAGDFSRRGIQIHTQVENPSVQTQTKPALVRLVLEDLLLQILEETDFNGDLCLSVQDYGGVPSINIYADRSNTEFFKDHLTMIRMILDSLHAHIEFFVVESNIGVFHIEFPLPGE